MFFVVLNVCAGYNDVDGAKCMHMKYNDPNYFLREGDRKRMGGDVYTKLMGEAFCMAYRCFIGDV